MTYSAEEVCVGYNLEVPKRFFGEDSLFYPLYTLHRDLKGVHTVEQRKRISRPQISNNRPFYQKTY